MKHDDSSYQKKAIAFTLHKAWNSILFCTDHENFWKIRPVLSWALLEVYSAPSTFSYQLSGDGLGNWL